MKIEDHLIKMKGGKLYAPVYVRIALFREDHPVADGWGINAEVISTDETSCLSRAEIVDPQGRVVATGHKREHKSHFPDFEEKSLTGAVGRALLMAGYGTQYALDELDEGERIVDTPIPAPAQVKAQPTVEKAPNPFIQQCRRLWGVDITTEDCKAIFTRAWPTSTANAESLAAAATVLGSYADAEEAEADLFMENAPEMGQAPGVTS
jgi:hypothetical protein